MEYRKLRYEILKKGRKWFEGKVPDKGWRAKIEINEISKDWEIGKVVEFYGKLDVQSSKYGTKVFVYPVSIQEVEKAMVEEKKRKYRELRGELESYVDKDWYPSKKAEELLKLAEELNRKEETQKFIEMLRNSVAHTKALKKYNQVLDRALNLRERDKVSYFDELMEKMKSLANQYEDIKKDFEKREERLMEIRHTLVVASKKRGAEKLLSYISNDVERKGIANPEYLDKIEMLLGELRKLGEKEYVERIYSEIESIAKKQEQIYRTELGKLHPETLEILHRHMADSRILQLVRRGHIKENTEYVEISSTGYWWRFRKYFGGISIALEPNKYLNLVPRENLPLLGRFKEALDAQQIYRTLQNLPTEGDALSDDELYESLPTGWNHLKREFVGILTPELKIEYISRRTDYTRSGANARLVVDSLPQEPGTLLLSYDGSHRHMYLTLYRRDPDGWRCLASVEDWLNDLIFNLMEKHVVPQLLHEEKDAEMEL